MNKHKLPYSKILFTLLLSIIIFGVGWCVWAADPTVVSDVSYVSTFFVSLMSWAWTIPAIVAWELMSNDLIYWQLLWLESFMYQLWTLMRTIANFALVAIIVSIIGQIISNGGKAWEIITKYGIRLLISWIFINASWFLMWTLVDISTIAIAGVGSIWSKFMTDVYAWWDAANVTWAEWLVKAIPDKIKVNAKWCVVMTTDNTNPKKNWVNIIANKSTITWPLIFLGAGMMKLQALGQNVGCDSTTLGDLSKATLKIWISMLMIIMFVIPLIVLAAFNLFRLLFIRWWIICSPLIVLLNLFAEEAKKFGLDDMSKYVSRNAIISGLFQPVFTVWAMVIGMMLVTGIYRAVDYTQTENLDKTASTLQWIVNKQSASSMSFPEDGSLGTISMVDVITEDPTGTIGGWFGYIIMSFAVCFILWMLVKMSFEISKNWIGQAFDAQDKMWKIFDGFSKNVKMPDLGLGTPLEWASLAETMKFINPETNQILKATEDYGKKRAKSDEDKASQNLETWFDFLQKNWFLTKEEEATAKTYADTKFDKGWGWPTTQLFKTIKDSADKNEKPNFKADRPGRNTYDILKKWYETWGKDSFNKTEIRINKGDKDPIKLGEFDVEMKQKWYLWAYINALKNMDKIEVKEDWKVKIEDKDIIGKQAVWVDIDFK